jgi:recombination protein RecR
MYEGVVQDLIDELGRLPGVGPKSAQRIAFHLLAADPADVRRLVEVLSEVKEKVRFCTICGNVASDDLCRVCADPRRDVTSICVVEEPKDVVAVERTREFRGRYHVLGGAISPIDGVGPDDLRIRELMTRLADGAVTELILATDPNLEGEATATDGPASHPTGEWPAGRRRSRVRRRGHAGPGLRGPPAARRLSPAAVPTLTTVLQKLRRPLSLRQARLGA